MVIKHGTVDCSMIRLKLAPNSFQHLDFDGFVIATLSLDATIMISKNFPTIGEYIVVLSIT